MRTTGRDMQDTGMSFISIAIATLLLTVTATAGNVITVTGTTAGEHLGVVAHAGDVDGDGVSDFLVGSPKDATQGIDAGSVQVVSGADGQTLLQLFGSSAGQQFGASVAGVGDVDGDGLDDIAIGSPALGIPGGSGSVSVVSVSSGETLWSASGAGGFGSALSGSRDLNGDGLADLLVGAPYQSPNGYNSGSAYGLSGADGSELFRLDGKASGDLFGSSVSSVDPTVGFSEPDGGVIIGATQGESYNERRGYVHVYDSGDFSLRYEIKGGGFWDRLGTHVEHAGDLDGDGIIDLLVSSDPRDYFGNPNAPGYVHVLSGADGTKLHTVSGSTGQAFGAAMAGLGDVDDDGYDDFAVGIPLSDGNGTDAGMVRLYSGLDASVIQQLSGSNAGDHFGAEVCFMGDINGDGLSDIGVAAPFMDGLAVDAGCAMALPLNRWKTMGGGLAGIDGVIPTLGGDGPLLAGTQVVLTLEAARPLSATSLALGTSLFLDPAVNEWVPVPETMVAGLITSATGDLSYTYTWPANANGLAVYYQFYIADPDADDGTARSNAVRGDAP